MRPIQVRAVNSVIWLKTPRSCGQDEWSHQDEHGDVSIEKHLHGRVSLQHFFPVGVVKSAPQRAEKNQDVPKEVTRPEIEASQVNARAHQHTRDGQQKARPSHPCHVFVKKNDGQDSGGNRQRQHQERRVAGQRHACAPGDQDLAGKDTHERQKEKQTDVFSRSRFPFVGVAILRADERIEHEGGQGHRSPDRHPRTHLSLHQLDAGELQSPHQIATEEQQPGTHVRFAFSTFRILLRQGANIVSES